MWPALARLNLGIERNVDGLRDNVTLAKRVITPPWREQLRLNGARARAGCWRAAASGLGNGHRNHVPKK
eukprot:11221927-Lingulodinium_polyedra.AAC.1